jgi:hypothetical protein
MASKNNQSTTLNRGVQGLTASDRRSKTTTSSRTSVATVSIAAPTVTKMIESRATSAVSGVRRNSEVAATATAAASTPKTPRTARPRTTLAPGKKAVPKVASRADSVPRASKTAAAAAGSAPAAKASTGVNAIPIGVRKSRPRASSCAAIVAPEPISSAEVGSATVERDVQVPMEVALERLGMSSWKQFVEAENRDWIELMEEEIPDVDEWARGVTARVDARYSLGESRFGRQLKSGSK